MKITDDLKSAKLIYLKGFLFVLLGSLAAAGVIVENPTARTTLLLAVAIWSFCRFYYFMFYVIEKYVDGSYKFAGIHSFLLYLMRTKKNE